MRIEFSNLKPLAHLCHRYLTKKLLYITEFTLCQEMSVEMRPELSFAHKTVTSQRFFTVRTKPKFEKFAVPFA